MTKQTRFSIFVSAFIMSIFLCTYSYAGYNYGFQHIVEDGDKASEIADGIIGETQMSFSILLKDALAEFTFHNSGPEASSITDIYFDDDVPLLIFATNAGVNKTGFEYSDNEDVEFTVGAKPGILPGGTNITFSSNYSYDSDKPTQPMGVNPGEWVKLYFTIAVGKTFDNLIYALDDESFRVGIHVQGFASDGSEAFVNGPGKPGDVVPEPATLFLFGFGLIGFAGISRNKS